MRHFHERGVPRREETGAEGEDCSGSEYETGSEEESSSVIPQRTRVHTTQRVRPRQSRRRERETETETETETESFLETTPE
jgi:hypothetical protein